MKFKIALLQILPAEEDQQKNLEKGIEYVKKARELSADLALFPELWNIGFTECLSDAVGQKRWEESAIDQNSNFFKAFVKAAKKFDINVALTYLEKHSPKPKNSVAIIDKAGNIALNYSKVFICDFGKKELLKANLNYDDIGCDWNCTPGDSFPVTALSGKEGDVKIGAMVCADREFPEAATQLMLNGAEIIVIPNACEWDNVRAAQLQSRAFENLCGVAMATYPSPKNNGHSSAYHCVAWEDGKIQNTKIVEADKSDNIFIAEFDLDKIREFRKKESWRMEYRRKWYGK